MNFAVAQFSEEERMDARTVMQAVSERYNSADEHSFSPQDLANDTGFDLKRVMVALGVLEAAGLMEKPPGKHDS